MIRIHKKSKITYASIRNGGLFLWEQDDYSHYDWRPLKGYVLQTELVDNDGDGCLVEYLEKQDADEYANEKRYLDEIERLKSELTTMETKLKEVEKESSGLNTHIEWLRQQNDKLIESLEQERSKRTKKKKVEEK